MTVLVGYSPQESGSAALELGVVMARSLGEPLVVTTVVASPYLDIQAPVDGDYRFAPAVAERSLAQARSKVSTDVDCAFEVTEARSISAGLSDAAERHAVSVVALRLLGRLPWLRTHGHDDDVRAVQGRVVSRSAGGVAPASGAAMGDLAHLGPRLRRL